MCSGDAPRDEVIYKIGDRFILMEFYDYMDDCGKAHVQIHELPEKQKKEIFDSTFHKVKKMPVWMNNENPIIISAEDFDTTISEGIDRAFEELWDSLTEKEYLSIKERIRSKIENKVKKSLMKNIKGLDN